MSGMSRLTMALIGACVVFGLLALAFALGVGRGYSWLPADPSKAPRLPTISALQAADFSLPAQASLAEVTQRPLFSPDRKPLPPDAAAAGPEVAAAPAVPLKVKLTGVIITPQVKLAMVLNEATRKHESLQVGMPLSGNQAGWTLVKLDPRTATFSNGKDSTDVSLDVSAKSGGAKPPAPRFTPAPPGTSAQNKASAALRKRIEQRRKELREQAAKVRERRAAQRNAAGSH